MSDPISPIRRYERVRRAQERAARPTPQAAAQISDGDVDTADIDAPMAPPESPKAPRRAGVLAFAAHLIGQSGQKRGLRAGDELRETARSTYLGTEYSGEADRRPRAGLIHKTEI